ncbi:MAG TPA: AcvB/VirJ family lysyl-phosphatidylglycerol hydrolase [Longimicrobiales bacterium]|nr:AcvB/VirJ family lysyl-phosphatidylglycerol hydrolase [Longimicrobiales bacterium]
MKLAPSRFADFEFHVGSFLDRANRAARPTEPEWRKMAGLDVLCVYGQAESRSPCPTGAPPQWTPVALPGGHHFDGNYRSIADRILLALAPQRMKTFPGPVAPTAR